MSLTLSEVVVRLRSDVAHAVRAATQDVPDTAELDAVLRRFGIALKPQHPGSTDPDLDSYFMIASVPFEQAERIAAALRELETVESAYVQPLVSPA